MRDSRFCNTAVKTFGAYFQLKVLARCPVPVGWSLIHFKNSHEMVDYSTELEQDSHQSSNGPLNYVKATVVFEYAQIFEPWEIELNVFLHNESSLPYTVNLKETTVTFFPQVESTMRSLPGTHDSTIPSNIPQEHTCLLELESVVWPQSSLRVPNLYCMESSCPISQNSLWKSVQHATQLPMLSQSGQECTALRCFAKNGATELYKFSPYFEEGPYQHITVVSIGQQTEHPTGSL